MMRIGAGAALALASALVLADGLEAPAVLGYLGFLEDQEKWNALAATDPSSAPSDDTSTNVDDAR